MVIDYAGFEVFYKIGGEGGIRTLDTLLTYTHFPGVRFRPLSHFTVLQPHSIPKGRAVVILSHRF